MATAQALVETYFGDLECGAFEKRSPTILLQGGSLFKQKQIEQTHLALAYPSVPRGDEREDVVNALNGILGGSMSARLFQEVREKRGLAYSVYSYVSSFPECATLNIYAGVNPSNAKEALDAIDEVVKTMKEKGVSQEEFLRSREQMKASMFFSNESSNAQMLLYGRHMLYFNQVFDFERKLEKINAMTHEMAQETLSFMFDERHKAFSSVAKSDEFLR